MFYNKFCSIVSYSVMKVAIEEPSCTGSSEPIQVFKRFNWLSSHSSLYKGDEIKVLDSLVVVWNVQEDSVRVTQKNHIVVGRLDWKWIERSVLQLLLQQREV